MKAIENMPGILQNTVKNYLKEFEYAKIIATSTMKRKPYKDENLIDTCYRVYVENGNMFSLFRYINCNRPELNDNTVHISNIMASDIEIFINNSKWFKGKLLR